MPYITIEYLLVFIMMPTAFQDLFKLSTAVIYYFHGHLYQYYQDDLKLLRTRSILTAKILWPRLALNRRIIMFHGHLGVSCSSKNIKVPSFLLRFVTLYRPAHNKVRSRRDGDLPLLQRRIIRTVKGKASELWSIVNAKRRERTNQAYHHVSM